MSIYENPSALFDVKDKVAVVTGASGALGGMAAKILAGAGAKLLLAADETKTIAEDCRKLGAEVGEVVTDISKPHTQALSEEIIQSAVDQFGRIDRLRCGSARRQVAADEAQRRQLDRIAPFQHQVFVDCTQAA